MPSQVRQRILASCSFGSLPYLRALPLEAGRIFPSTAPIAGRPPRLQLTDYNNKSHLTAIAHFPMYFSGVRPQVPDLSVQSLPAPQNLTTFLLLACMHSKDGFQRPLSNGLQRLAALLSAPAMKSRSLSNQKFTNKPAVAPHKCK